MGGRESQCLPNLHMYFIADFSTVDERNDMVAYDTTNQVRLLDLVFLWDLPYMTPLSPMLCKKKYRD